MTSRLTLNAGLRYEFTTQVEEIHGHGAAVRDMVHDTSTTPGLPFLTMELVDGKPLTEVIMGMAERVGKEAFLHQQKAIMGRPDGREDLRRIACPTLVLCGRQDALTPLALHEEIAGLVPGAKLVVVEDCGHLSTLEKPITVAAALRQWLLA